MGPNPQAGYATILITNVVVTVHSAVPKCLTVERNSMLFLPVSLWRILALHGINLQRLDISGGHTIYI